MSDEDETIETNSFRRKAPTMDKSICFVTPRLRPSLVRELLSVDSRVTIKKTPLDNLGCFCLYFSDFYFSEILSMSVFLLISGFPMESENDDFPGPRLT